MHSTVSRLSSLSTRRTLLLSCLLSLSASFATAAIQTAFIDDTDSRVSYNPPDQWSEGNTCIGCAINPDPARAFQGTWHDTTYILGTPARTITVQFTGTGVAVFNFIANTIPATTLTNLTFFIDNVQAGQYVHPPDPQRTDIQDHVQVFGTQDLTDDLHTLVIEASTTVTSVVLFDYIQYTFDDENNVPPPLPSPSAAASQDAQQPAAFPTGGIIGVVLGTVVLLGVVAGFLFWYIRRRHRRARPQLIPFPIPEVEKTDALLLGGAKNSADATVGNHTAFASASQASPVALGNGSMAFTAHNKDLSDSGYTSSDTSAQRNVAAFGSNPAQYPSGASPAALAKAAEASGIAPSPTSTALPRGYATPTAPHASDEREAFSEVEYQSTSPSTSRSGTQVSLLRTVTAMQEELTRIREEQERQRLVTEAPPTYDEAETN